MSVVRPSKTANILGIISAKTTNTILFVSGYLLARNLTLIIKVKS